MTLDQYLLPMVVAFLLSMVCVPLVKLLALRFNVVDNPNARKVHREPIPLLGGLGILIPFLITLFCFYKANSNLNLKGAVISGLLVVALGFWDDFTGGITWRTKLLGQLIIAAITVFGFGISIAVFSSFWLNALISMFFLVYITNSFNLMDNMDGLSAGVASIAGVFFCLLAFQQRQYDLALFSIVLAASAFGFLKYNFSPASIFMGDLGSMFLGYTLGCIAIRLQVAEISTWQIMIYHADFVKYPIYWMLKHLITSAIPLLVVAVPLFDTLLVVILRTLHGLKISTPGKDHSSHRLTKVKGWMQRKIDKFILLVIRATGRRKKAQQHVLRGMAQTRAVLILYACSTVLGLIALVVPSLTLKSGLLVFILVVIIAGVSIKKFNEVVVYSA